MRSVVIGFDVILTESGMDFYQIVKSFFLHSYKCAVIYKEMKWI